MHNPNFPNMRMVLLLTVDRTILKPDTTEIDKLIKWEEADVQALSTILVNIAPNVQAGLRLLPAVNRKWENTSEYKIFHVEYNFLFYHVIWTLFFSLFPITTAKTCSGGLVLFGRHQNHRCLMSLEMPFQSRLREHTMPTINDEVQREVEEQTGTRPCIWQIEVVHMVLDGNDVIMIAATGSGKSFPYWMPLLYIKHGIVILVTPLKLLGKQFVDMLEKNQLRAVSMTAANATNEVFEVSNLKWTQYKYLNKQTMLHCSIIILVAPTAAVLAPAKQDQAAAASFGSH